MNNNGFQRRGYMYGRGRGYNDRRIQTQQNYIKRISDEEININKYTTSPEITENIENKNEENNDEKKKVDEGFSTVFSRRHNKKK
jgi:hypothetical protein